MSCNFSLHIPKALPSLSSIRCRRKQTPLSIISEHKPTKLDKKLVTSITKKVIDVENSSLGIQIGAMLWATFEQPAFAVTGENNYEIDLTTVIIKLGIIAFWYFLIMPPIILNWLWLRWYRRKLLEMYLQFMCVFLFFPGLMLWAPFLNFRKFPRDPSLKYPWDTPADPSQVKSSYLKFPWAQPEDYDVQG